MTLPTRIGRLTRISGHTPIGRICSISRLTAGRRALRSRSCPLDRAVEAPTARQAHAPMTSRRAWARSVASQVNRAPSRPKWP